MHHRGQGAFFGCGQRRFKAEYTATEHDHALAGSHGVAQLSGVAEVPEGGHPWREDRV
ncbi:hypothetical protein AHiyo8_16130 [Arthrobacter sp. Hiyo8]|nr:hypothetical protein AHiyo8_16130 [Arthrobacter sp. Hiyo8]